MNKKVTIAVVDGQGGKIGKEIISRLKKALGESISVGALGTNTVATSTMLRGGADYGATGENAIIYNVKKSDIVIGAIGIIMPNSMHGELAPGISEAIGQCDALKVLIPIERCNIRLAMPRFETVEQSIEMAVSIVKDQIAPSPRPVQKIFSALEVS